MHIHHSSSIIPHIDGILELQDKYHVSNLSEAERTQGFVTTKFSREQLAELIQKSGVFVATVEDRVVAYALAADWNFWLQWPLFEHMVSCFPQWTYKGLIPTLENSYQYGPVCIDTSVRGQGVLEALFKPIQAHFSNQYPIGLTFINQKNPRSLAAHTRKLGMEIVGTFEYNGNAYWALGW